MCLLCARRVASSCRRTTATFPGVCPTRGASMVRRGNDVGGLCGKVKTEELVFDLSACDGNNIEFSLSYIIFCLIE